MYIPFISSCEMLSERTYFFTININSNYYILQKKFNNTIFSLTKIINDPLDLPKFCDSCNASFSIFQALDYNYDGLVTARHNEPRHRAADLAGKDFTPMHMRYDPLIFQVAP